MSWIPHITVASIIEKDKKYLFVEELVDNLIVINQPSGHLEENETIENACIRETLEETAYIIKVDYIIGIYQERKKNSKDMWLRFCFKCSIIEELLDKKLDKNIIKKLWMSKEDIQKKEIKLRNNMVLKSLEDYQEGKNFSKNLICSLFEK